MNLKINIKIAQRKTKKRKVPSTISKTCQQQKEKQRIKNALFFNYSQSSSKTLSPKLTEAVSEEPPAASVEDEAPCVEELSVDTVESVL